MTTLSNPTTPTQAASLRVRAAIAEAERLQEQRAEDQEVFDRARREARIYLARVLKSRLDIEVDPETVTPLEGRDGEGNPTFHGTVTVDGLTFTARYHYGDRLSLAFHCDTCGEMVTVGDINSLASLHQAIVELDALRDGGKPCPECERKADRKSAPPPVSRIDDGGEAFPSNEDECSGLSKRDYFAAKAMQGFISRGATAAVAAAEAVDLEPSGYISLYAYRMADAMNAARKSTEGRS